MTVDLYHYIGGDLSINADGSLRVAKDTDLGQQRVLRRLLTNPGDYIWHQDYGAGLPRSVGSITDIAQIKALIRQHMFLEPAVSRTPDPIINVTAIADGVSVDIKYNDANYNQPVVLQFDVAR